MNLRTAAALAATCFLSVQASAHSDAPSLAEGMRRTARSSVYLVQEKSGIVARSVDGGFRRVLIAGDECSAIYDASAELIFYSRADKLWAFDLRESDPKPTAVVEMRDAYRSDLSGSERYCAEYALEMSEGRSQSTNPESPVWGLRWQKAEVWSVPLAKPPVIVGTWLRAQAARPLRPPQRVWTRRPIPLGQTGLTFVFKEHPDRYGPTPLCLLKDRAGQLHAAGDVIRAWSGDWRDATCDGQGYEMDSTGRAWITRGAVFTIKSRVGPNKGEILLGWLDPGLALLGGSAPQQ